MFKHILVPLDGSQLAESALPPACELATKFDSKITLLRVTSLPMIFSHVDGYVYGDLVNSIREQNRDEANAYLNRMKRSLRQQGYVVHTHIIEDESPAKAILSVAEAQDMDSVVMSTHGRGGAARWVFGSVADKVLRHSRVPVLLVRAKEKMPMMDNPVISNEADFSPS